MVSLMRLQYGTFMGRGAILPPHQDLMKSIMLAGVPQNDIEDALRAMVKLARERGDRVWLRSVANQADSLQFRSRPWVCRNIYNIGESGWSASSQPPTVLSRDVRRDAESDLEPSPSAALGANSTDCDVTPERVLSPSLLPTSPSLSVLRGDRDHYRLSLSPAGVTVSVPWSVGRALSRLQSPPRPALRSRHPS
jgi:hypothetical protein